MKVSATGVPGESKANPRSLVLDITVGDGAPDCYSRKVIYVNRQFQPAITFTQGEWVQVTVKNNIPTWWPTTSKGITIHWHGFGMRGFQWQDGTKFGSMCPIASGTSFSYLFQVNEMPGTYFWHDHANANRADGLQGPLFVNPKPGTTTLYPLAGSPHLFLQDWWHQTGNSLAMRLNRPFDPNQQTTDSGNWCWVGVPKAILLNGKGNYYGCEDVYTRQVGQPMWNGQNATAADLMSPSPCVAGQLGGSAAWSMCRTTPNPAASSAAQQQCQKRFTEIIVPSRSVTTIRIVNAAMLVYMTVCIEKHTLTVVALDAAPVEPRVFNECVDINAGQRVDIRVEANQPLGRYWISVGSQYRKGAPAGYGFLTYREIANTPVVYNDNFIQPQTFDPLKWNQTTTMSFRPSAVLYDPALDPAKAAAYLAPNAPLASFKMPDRPLDARFLIQSTQPLIEANGILRWAFDNIAHATAPPCKPILDEVYDNPNWVKEKALAEGVPFNQALYFTPVGGSAETWQGNGEVQVADNSMPNGYNMLNLNQPGAGTHTLSLQGNKMIEIVVQNNRAGAYGGQYNSSSSLTNNRNGREQHAFHLHGHHVWLVGMGMGEWTAEKEATSDYNLVNPILRDTVTVLFNGTTETKAAWVAFRFVTDNAGVWPLHCHIAWHEMMGQGLAIIEDAEGITKLEKPTNMPYCPEKCLYSHTLYSPAAVQTVYGDSGLIAPENSNLP